MADNDEEYWNIILQAGSSKTKNNDNNDNDDNDNGYASSSALSCSSDNNGQHHDEPHTTTTSTCCSHYKKKIAVMDGSVRTVATAATADEGLFDTNIWSSPSSPIPSTTTTTRSSNTPAAVVRRVTDASVRTVATVPSSTEFFNTNTTNTSTSPPSTKAQKKVEGRGGQGRLGTTGTGTGTGRKVIKDVVVHNHDDAVVHNHDNHDDVVEHKEGEDKERQHNHHHHHHHHRHHNHNNKDDKSNNNNSIIRFWKLLSLFFGIATIGFFISTVCLAATKEKKGSKSSTTNDDNDNDFDDTTTIRKPPTVTGGTNTCDGSKIDLPNIQCIVSEIGEQAGSNVTKGYNGNFDTQGVVPITEPYYQVGLCPVNVHWHLGTEHYSLGQYDEYGIGPIHENDDEHDEDVDVDHHDDDDEEGEDEHHNIRHLSGETRMGFQCHHYDENDDKFIKPYNWKHCLDMEVGQTYEVHWPHSAAGACGTLDQYQTPFYDGVFCNLSYETLLTLSRADIANAVGVQSQTFTIVNDETYYYPDLMRGMIVDKETKFGTDLAMYTGSTTGTSRNNELCSQYTPITWQVDRICHLISASSFDKMCSDMKSQRDDMSDDLYPHGSRELVHDDYAANNHQNLRQLRHQLRGY